MTDYMQDYADTLEAEGMAEPTDEQLKMLKRYRTLMKRRDAVEEEMKAIVSNLRKDFEADQNLNALVVNGKKVALLSGTTVTKTDMEKFREDFPEVVATYVQTLPKYQSKVYVPRKTFTVRGV